MISSVWSRRAALAAISLAVLSTVAFLPDALYRWVLPKELVLVVACLLALFAVASGRLPRWLWAVGAAALLVLLVAALTGAAPLSQLFGRWPRYEGLITLPVYGAAGWMGARLLGPTAGAARYRAFHSAAAVAAILVGVVSVFESLGLRPIASNLARPGSLLGNATDQGIVGVMLAAVLLVPALDTLGGRLRQLFLGAGLVLAIAAVVLSASRAAIIALAIVAVLGAVMIVVRTAPRLRPRSSLIALASFLAIGGLALAIPLTRTRLLGTSPSAGQSTDARLVMWDTALRLFAEHPLLGVGPSGFLDAITPLKPASWANDMGANVTVDSPHNWVLQAAMAGGIPLLLCAVATAALVLFAGFRAWRREASAGRSSLLAGATLAVLGYGVALLTHFTTPGTTILAAFLAGAVVAVAPGAPVAVAVQRVRIGVVSLWVLLLGLTTVAELPLNAGVQAAAAGETAAASEAFAAAQGLRPWDADVSSIAAQSFAASAEREAPGAAGEAVRWATRSLDLVPDSVLSAKALAVGLQYSGEIEGAKQVLQELNERSPFDPQVLHRLGGLRFLLGEFALAVENLEQATELDPENPEIWATLQYVYEQTGDSAGAARALARIRAIEG